MQLLPKSASKLAALFGRNWFFGELAAPHFAERRAAGFWVDRDPSAPLCSDAELRWSAVPLQTGHTVQLPPVAAAGRPDHENKAKQEPYTLEGVAPLSQRVLSDETRTAAAQVFNS